MNIINNVNDTIFTLNGIRYFKNFAPLVRGGKIALVNVYDSNLALIDFSGVDKFTVNGSTFSDLPTLVQALIPVVYVRDVSGGGGGVTVHNDLTGRDANDAHPISAITGLTEALANTATPTIVVQTATPVTAQFSRRYLAVFDTTSFTDPTPQEGEFEVIVGNGLATVGGVQYSEGTRIVRRWHSGAWTSYVYRTRTQNNADYLQSQAITLPLPSGGDGFTSAQTIAGVNQLNKNVLLTTGSINRNYDVQSALGQTNFIKLGTGRVTFITTTGRTLVDASGESLTINSNPNSSATIVSVGTTDYIYIYNV